MIMKKASILILIAAFLFPAYGSAATAPAKQTPEVSGIDINSPILQGKTLTAKKAAVLAALTDIYTQLTKLSAQTQEATNQLSSNGIATAEAQTALTASNASLAKAKNDIAVFNAIIVSNTRFSSFTLDLMKNTANTAESSLSDARQHLLDSLTALKASVANL
ncbi:MAG: hypothetical protein JWL92_243 [Candidatus Nomurabacteria bacterium]|nr:hypothetical protein [Candidatus Nomurabacteria bacterium]